MAHDVNDVFNPIPGKPTAPIPGKYDKLIEAQKENRPWVQKYPGWATTGAGALSGLSGLFGGLFGEGGFMGKGERQQQVPMFSPEIMKLKNLMGPEIWKQISGNQFDFGPIEEQARQGFQSRTLPSIMNRFNMGDNKSSSGMFGALGQAGQGLDAQLAAMRQNYGLQRQGLLSSMFGNAMSPSFETVNRERKPGGMEQGLGTFMQILPLLLTMM